MKDPAFLLYYKDFDNDTADWEPEALGWYMRLLFFQAGNGYIPSDIEEIAQIARVKFSEYQKFQSAWSKRISVKFSDTLSDTQKLENKKLSKVQNDRKENAMKKSILAVFGNFIKSKKLSVSEKNFLKDEFHKNNDFSSIKDDEKRKKTIIKFLENKLKDFNQRNAKRTHYANANEDANVNKDVIEKEKGGMGEKSNLKIPWETENFKTQWQHWKVYKKKEFGFKFKSLQSEQAALTELANKSGGEEKTAIKIIHQSMSNGWKGLFELKENYNGITKPRTINRQTEDVIRSNMQGWELRRD